MKKIIVRFVVLLCSLAILLPTFSSYADDISHFTRKGLFVQEKIAATPTIIEATLLVEQNAPDERLGTIVGNYCRGDTPAINFEIRENGAVSLYVSNGKQYTLKYFEGYDVRNGKKTSLKCEIDFREKTAVLYANEKSVSSVAIDVNKPNNVMPFAVGGDLRGGNAQFLKPSAQLFDVKLSDENGVICEYNLTQGISDVSENGYDLVKVEGSPQINVRSQYEYRIDRPLECIPKYFEAEIIMDFLSPGGVIAGNFGGNGIAMNFEINGTGNPVFRASVEGKAPINVVFSDVVVPKKKTFVLSVMMEDTDETSANYTCLIDGAARQTVAGERIPGDAVFESAFSLCNDNDRKIRDFYGEIKRISFYADSAKQNLTADITLPTGPNNVKDSTGKYEVLCSSNLWTKNGAGCKDYAYSIAVVGDIQTIVGYYPEELHKINDWILKNKDEKKIKFCFYNGDLTEHDVDIEWKLSMDEIFRLNGKIPYSVVRGNHDSAEQFLKFSNQKLNYSQKIKMGNDEFLIISLDYGPDDDTLKWAADQIAANPKSRVIINTHAYLFRDGTTLDENDVWPPSKHGGFNDGDDIWEKLVRKYGNIEMVICGHDPSDDVVMTKQKGDFGNTVIQLLVDPQNMEIHHPYGMVFLMYFSKDGKFCECEYYSTVNELYRIPTNGLKFGIGEGAVHYSYFHDANGDKRLSVRDASYIAKKGATSKQNVSGDDSADRDDGAYLLKHFMCKSQYVLNEE